MAHQLNSPVISTTLNIPFILVDRYQYTSPLVRHLVRSKNMVEQFGYPYYSYVPETSPHLDWDTIQSHRLTSVHPFQRLYDLRFLDSLYKAPIGVIKKVIQLKGFLAE